MSFYDAFRRALPRRNVYLDLSAVEHFSIDALLVIRSIMESPESRPHSVSGNLPNDRQVASEFMKSGFFEGFDIPPARLPEAQGIIRTEFRYRVFSDVAAELVQFASKQVRFDHVVGKACFQNLVELMTNTRNHAADSHPSSPRRRSSIRWAAGVYCRSGVAHFAFVDLGVGILDTAPHKGRIQRMYSTLRSGRCAILADVFEGRLGSVTGQPGRGHGLPRLRRDARNGRLPDLRVLTADVHGSVTALRFQNTPTPFHGTLFRWSIDSEV